MNSLVSYDDSDSDTERTEHLKAFPKEHSVKSFAMSFSSRVYENDDLSKDRTSNMCSGLSSTNKDINKADCHNHAKTYFSGAYSTPSVNATTSFASALRDTKRPASDAADSNTTVKPYIPKRLRQEQLHNNDSVGKVDTVSHTQFSKSIALENVYRVSDYLKPFLLSKYTSTEIPRNLVFQMNEHTGPVNRVQWCPVRQHSHLLLSASMDTTIKVIHIYKAGVQQHFEVLFLPGGKEFLSTTDSVSRDSADRTIIAWDFQTAAKISNQIFHERYTCPSLALHPKESIFVAQTNGNYMALFSTQRPYKMDKKKRFEGHKVEGFAVGCEFSPDGSLLVTGSSEGTVSFYSYHTARIVRSISGDGSACISVNFHPVLSSLLATSYWDGQIRIWQ
ncbi:WD repeat-containing protein 25 isoform X2 [Xenopus tropicalis]|uniref:WD repeat-containing protein 25 isoform X2 n=1 Tax=Xenopus tropicalis TaxID=8364 RepID=A0A8J1IQF6_XENTR|nr:WD repeat-containing protein 25 isoform X2 [Xenopus tropicalis]